jgi:hypothetical protein
MALDRIKKFFGRDLHEEDRVSADTTINKTCNEISAAFARRLKGRNGITASATVSIKIQKIGGTGADAKFAICGVRAEAGAERTHGNVHTVSITFTPTPNTNSGSENEFDKAFEQLQPLLDTSSDYVKPDVAIDLDFSITEQGKFSILAAGDFKDDSTHHVALTLTPEDKSTHHVA